MGSGIRYCPQHEWLGAGIDFLPVKELSLSRLKETLKIAGKSPVTSLSFKHWKTWLSLLIFNYDASFQKYKLRKHCVLTVRNSWNFSNLHPKYCHLKTNKQNPPEVTSSAWWKLSNTWLCICLFTGKAVNRWLNKYMELWISLPNYTPIHTRDLQAKNQNIFSWSRSTHPNYKYPRNTTFPMQSQKEAKPGSQRGP